jgi:hypothetical protein
MTKHYYEYLDAAMKDEIKELMEGEHGAAIEAWGYECANAACKRHVTNILLAVLAGVGVTYTVVKRRQSILDSYVRKNVAKTMKDVIVK